MNKRNKTEEDFLRVYDNHSDSLFRHCYFRVSNKEVATDMVQESFLRLWRTIEKGKEINEMTPYLYKIANNMIIDHYRKKKDSSLDVMEEIRGGSINSLEYSIFDNGKIETDAEMGMLLSALQEIDQDYRDAFIMRHIDGLSPKDIAKIMNCSENLVSVRVNRAFKMLREKLNIDI